MSVMLASDANNPNFAGATNPDAALSVRFYSRPVQNMAETSLQNRPIYQDIDYIEIFTPGNQLNIIDTPVREEHKRRFPIQWAAYQNLHHGDQREIGTPISQWSYLSAAQAEELKAIKFFTVENVANASDAQIQSIGMIGGMAPAMLRERAKAFLSAAQGTAVIQHDAEEKAQLKEQLAALQRQVAAMAKPEVPAILQAPPEVKEDKPKRVLSPEHLAKLAAGRAASKAAKEPQNAGS
jgi:hypothetical protein